MTQTLRLTVSYLVLYDQYYSPKSCPAEVLEEL